MRIKIQITFETQEIGKSEAAPVEKIVEQLIKLERSEGELTAQTLGMSMSEAKSILAGVQQSYSGSR